MCPRRLKAHKFVDTAKVRVAAGAGGDGCVSFRREKFVPRGGPDGGDGGRGGHVLAEADRNVDSLLALYFNPLQRAADGERGRGKQQHGRNGRDLVIKLPCGTEIHDLESGAKLGELLEDGGRMQLAAGGRGGLGNCHWKTSTHQAPREHTEGAAGEAKHLRFDLKIIAEIGLIGFPNAGKSTLLGKISHAHPRVGAYPFTTLNPIIGTVKYPEAYREIRVVDIPGLIDGAHAGAGLGHEFLRHVERARALLLVLDMAGSEGREPLDDYRNLREELRLYRAGLLQRPMLVAANKMDLPEAAANLAEFQRQTGVQPLPISAREELGLTELRQAMLELMCSMTGTPGLQADGG